MEPPRWLTSAVLFLAWSDAVRAGWYLDYSCYDQADNIKRSMASAFDLATAGSQALEQAAAPLPGSATTAQKQTHQAQVDLVSYIFQEMMDGKTVNKNAPEYINGKSVLDDVQQFKDFKGIVYPGEMEWVDRLIATGQGKKYKPPPRPPAGVTTLNLNEYKAKEDIFVYCDFSRFGDIDVNCLGKKVTKKPGDTKSYWCNKALNHMEVESALVNKCRTQAPKTSGRTDMYTSSFGGSKYDTSDPGQPLATKKPDDIISSEVQFCPTYYDDFKVEKIKTFADKGPQPAASRSKSIWKKLDQQFDKLLSIEDNVTPIDYYKTSDVIFLHEMTHALWGAGTDDVGKAYGWLNIRDISKQKSPKNTEKASNNADNLAYFALGAKMISPGSSKTPERAYDDGSVKALAKAKVRRAAWTTMQRLRRADATSSKHSEPTSSKHTSSAGHSQEVLYKTVRTVFTTVMTKKVEVPWTTVIDAHPHPPQSDGGASSSAKSTSSTSSSRAGPAPGGSKSSAKSDHSKSSQSSHGKPAPSSKKSDHSKPTSSRSRSVPPGPTTSSAAAAQHTTVTVTSDHSTSTVVFVGAPLPNPKGKGKPGWKCTGPICDPKCLFPALCKKIGGGWGFKPGWKPVPAPGGPPPPPGGPSPAPTDDGEPPKSEPKNSEPKNSEPKNSEPKSSHKESSASSSSSSSSCRPRVTSVCPVVATVLAGSDGKETTKRATQACKTTTLHDCSTTVHGATSTTTLASSGPTVTPLAFVDDFDMGVANFQSIRDAVLAAMIADTTDAYEYVDQPSTPPTTTSKPTKSSSHKPSASPTSHKSTSKASSDHKPSTKPSTKPNTKPTTSHKSSSSSKPKPPPSSPSKSASSASKPAGPAYTPHCGTIQSKVSQHTFEFGDNPVFKDFCKGWSSTKESSKTVDSDGGMVTLEFKPDKGGKKCTMNCDDAYSSMAIACAQGDGNGNMYTTGSGDFSCGVFSFSISAKPAYIPKCGTTVSKVSQHTFEFGDNPVFKDFCSSWKQDKKSSYTVYADGGHVALSYEPDNSSDKCTMSCSDAYSSMAIACAEGDGNGNMYTTGSGDFSCGKFSWEITPTPAQTTFYFGSLSGDTQGGAARSGRQDSMCNYVIVKSGDDICKAGNFVPSNDSKEGGCSIPGLQGPNFCGSAIGMGYPKGYMLKKDDDCGQTETKQYKTDISKAVPKGTHYADIIDADNGNQKVGECVYDLQKTGYCTDVITTLIPEKFITCTVN